MSDALAASGLTRTFPGRRAPALDKVSFTVAAGEVVALCGRNGAGKTTLLDVLSTLLFPSAGRASVKGADVVGDDTRVRRAIGYAMAGPRGLYMRLSARANLEFFAALHPGVGDTRARVAELSDALGMQAFIDEPIRACSDGMQQHVVIARALLGRPRVLLLDEPSRALDIVARQRVARLIAAEVQKGAIDAVLHATHDLEALPDLSSRAIVLEAGRLVYDGAPDRARVMDVLGGEREA